MFRLERITKAGYQVKVQWECEFELPEDMDMEEVHLPLRTRDALYGGRTEAMRLHYKVKEGEETIEYVDIMSLYPWVCKYFKFPIGHPTIHWNVGTFPPCSQKDLYGTWCYPRGTCSPRAVIWAQWPSLILSE
jgi:hypothetical protein